MAAGEVEISMKRILFVTIHFREYIDRIKKAIETEMDSKVDIIFCDYENYWKNWVIMRSIGKENAKKINQRNQNKHFSKIPDNYYDYIFVLVGRGLDCKSFGNFMKHQKKAKKILYLWDDIKRVDEYKDLKDYFDDIVSFDVYDCEKFNIRYVPVFFCDEYRYNGEVKDIDFSCIGGRHTYRESLLANIQKEFPKDKYNWYVLLSVSIFRYIYIYILTKLLQGKTNDFIEYKELGISDAAQISKRSKIVIDMPHLSQKGASTRTIESLAAHAKIVTTNNAISRYDFYDPNNICVIDVNNPVIPDKFLYSEYVEPDENIVEKYSLNHWVKAIFDNTED